MSGNFQKFFSYSLYLVAALSFLLFLGRAPSLFQRLSCPLQVTQAEAYKVEFGRNLVRGQKLYPDATQGPYLYVDYPPLFPALEALPQFFGEKNPWLSGRLLAFAGYLGCALGLLAWGWRRWDKKAALALSFLFLISPTWTLWGSMARADCPMIFVQFCAFLFLVLAEREGDGKRRKGKFSLIAAGFLTALAFFIKQNAALLAVAYGLYCLFTKKTKKCLSFLVPFLGSVLSVTALLEAVTQGQYLKYTFFWLPLGYKLEWFWDLFRDSFLPECGWLAAVLFFTWITRKTSPLLCCQMALCTFWLLGLGRAGSAESFYLEFTLYGIYFLGEAWALKGAKPPRASASSQWQSSPVLLPAFLALGLFFFGRAPSPPVPSPEERQMKEAMLSLYAGEGEHLALDADLLVMAGKKVWLQPMEFSLLVQKGEWSPEPLLQDIRSKKFKTVEIYDLPSQFLLPESVVEEIGKNYHVMLRRYGRLWLAPNP